jgi:hypothetical protein
LDWCGVRTKSRLAVKDGTLALALPADANSIVPSFRILLTSGQTLAWSDLSVGTNMSIYTRVYHLYSCDAFTRHFMDSQGKSQAADSEPPLDPFHHQLEQKKHLMEEARARVHVCDRPVNSQYYLENARKVSTCTSMRI